MKICTYRILYLLLLTVWLLKIKYPVRYFFFDGAGLRKKKLKAIQMETFQTIIINSKQGDGNRIRILKFQ